ncbi:uncharacterized protein LOC124383388 isoform X2 [Silurus meridionalis]|uniref:uncharacterized protein LOC124383388 isoform X2 n=1 Tax=Silurus meridionalis TaxID=175797 RepID=UPI001EEB22B0|nr:uncharacterized protein LOC124383388 isoform X2 [Silurus meridionalis]
MQLSVLYIFTWVLIFCCRIQALSIEAQRGADVTLSCKVSDIPERSIVQWERNEVPILDSTLFYNRTAYIILHNVDQRSQGEYHCILKSQGKKEIYKTQTLVVSEYAQSKKYILYRECSNSSSLFLICKSKTSYHRVAWIRVLNKTKEVMIAAEKEKNLTVHEAIVPGEHSSKFYNGNDFVFHISPVKFNYSGAYRCLVDNKNTYSSIMLHTVRVFAEPDVLIRNQSVLLTCEVSDITENVILAWLRMEGNMAMLIKQGVLTRKDKKREVSVSLNRVYEDQLFYQCAVFSENKLRALAPIKLHLVQSLREGPQSAIPKHTTVPTRHAITGNTVEENIDTQTLLVAVFTLFGFMVVVLGALVFYRRRKSSTDAGMGKAEDKDEEVHYETITIVELDHGACGNIKRNKIPDTIDSVIYSTINYSTNKSEELEGKC